MPPATVRWRVARSSVRSSSCEASITVAPADAASRMTWSIGRVPPDRDPSEARQATRGEGGERPPQRGRCDAVAPQKIPHRNVTQAFGDAEAVERRRHRFVVDARCTSPETQVLLDGQVVIERRVVPEQPDRPSHGSAVGHQIVAQHLGPARLNPQQAGADPQQGRLAGAVGPWTSTISLSPTSRSAPASAGNRPSKATTPWSETMDTTKR